MLQTLKEKKLHAKLSKCSFWLQNMSFIGHVISSGGIDVDPSNIYMWCCNGRLQSLLLRLKVFLVLLVTTGSLSKSFQS